MAEPDGVMPGSLWPPDWNTGWVTWRYANILGQPKQGKVRLSLAVGRAVSPEYETAIIGGVIEVTLVDGKPSGDFVQLNSAGVPCIEVPRGDDPDVVPNPIQIIADEVFSDGGGAVSRFVVSAEHTLNAPLWISGNLNSVSDQPGVVAQIVWYVPLEESGPPALAQVDDVVWYIDTGHITQITSL
ncbi:hypothetical protein [Herbiconiux sp. VKM Ac-2851]|uniref:hypothetical protein n=1 Tax=Herbiconiux sp. VKM Ac-2851 TaxID=2739025 RepID=UPI0015638818|nr:hypothetical protein [Herbiconiux sp. VKM Ac-2851]NQX36239.1 hypothetical protein [Herbiconiux sp. VKM Ac-2851]